MHGYIIYLTGPIVLLYNALTFRGEPRYAGLSVEILYDPGFAGVFFDTNIEIIDIILNYIKVGSHFFYN
jgi:hypothetical protein